MLSRLTGIVVALFGLTMLWMGGELLLVGGSPFYVVIALGLLLTAILLFKKKPAALTVYAVVMWMVLA